MTKLKHKELFIIIRCKCNPFSLAGWGTSKKFRCQHNKENLQLVSAHILCRGETGLSEIRTE